MNLVTLAQIKRYCGIPTAYTDDDALMVRLLIEAEEWADRTTQRRFKPIIETRRFDWQDAYNLYFNDDLCELVTITNGDSSTTNIPLTEVVYMPRRDYPKFGVIIKRGSSYIWEFDDTTESAISLKAAWCCHDDWGNAWVDSLDEVEDAAGINASVTTITVTNVDGANVNTDSPRFSAGMLIKIESEWMEVTAATNSTTDSLTVKRGSLGSTAATHAKDTKIYVFQPHKAVAGAIMAYVHWRYNQKNNRADYGTEIPADITALLPAAMGVNFDS